MQPSILGTTLRHFWPVFLIGFLGALGAGAGAWFATGPSHNASSSVTLIPPVSTVALTEDTPTQGNPLFYLSGLTLARDIVISQLNSASVVDDYEARYPKNEYSVTQDPMSTGPIIVFKVTGSEPEPVLRQLSDLSGSVSVVLLDLQERLDVPESARVRTLEITRDSETTVERKGQVRNAIAGFGLVLVSTAIAIAVLERRYQVRQGSPVDPVTKPQNIDSAYPPVASD